MVSKQNRIVEKTFPLVQKIVYRTKMTENLLQVDYAEVKLFTESFSKT